VLTEGMLFISTTEAQYTYVSEGMRKISTFKTRMVCKLLLCFFLVLRRFAYGFVGNSWLSVGGTLFPQGDAGK